MSDEINEPLCLSDLIDRATKVQAVIRVMTPEEFDAYFGKLAKQWCSVPAGENCQPSSDES